MNELQKDSSLRRLIVEFTKMSGAGNDFIVVDNRFYNFSTEELSSIAIRACARRTGVGADGILALGSEDREALDFNMLYFNADGSRGTMCGNGARCLSKFARLAGVGQKRMIFSSDAGDYTVDVPDSDGEDVTLFVPQYQDYKRYSGSDVLPVSLTGLLSELPPGQSRVNADYIDYVWTGTEHIVCWVHEVDTLDVARLGPTLRAPSSFAPDGANVNFALLPVESAAKDASEGGRTGGSLSRPIRVRTFEKGVEAETLACGTGALAVSISAVRRGLIAADTVEIQMNGGMLTVGYSGDIANPQELSLTGPADVIYRGTFEI